jgi:hypothetical protein
MRYTGRVLFRQIIFSGHVIAADPKSPTSAAELHAEIKRR